MRTLFSINKQTISVFIKFTESTLKSYDLEFGLVYRAFDTSKLKLLWSRHLDDYMYSCFVGADDLMKLNIFNPYRKLVRLNVLEEQNVAYNIINSFASQREEIFNKVVFCCFVKGFDETFIMASGQAAEAISTVLAMRVLEDKSVAEKGKRERLVK